METGRAKQDGRRQLGFTATELIAAMAVFTIVVGATTVFLVSSLDAFGEQQSESSLWSSQQATLLRIREDVEEACSLDPMFQVTSSTLRFREITGHTDSGARTYGDTIEYRIEGPVAATGGTQAFRLVRSIRDSTNTVLIHESVLVADLTATDDPQRPTRFSFATPFVTVQLVQAVPGRDAGEEVTHGTRERIRLHY